MPADLSEDDVSVKYITPALVRAGWDEATQIRRQVGFTKGRIIVRGRLVGRGRAKKADFVLYRQHIPLAVIEAKKTRFTPGHGLQQALDYAEALQAPFVSPGTARRPAPCWKCCSPNTRTRDWSASSTT